MKLFRGEQRAAVQKEMRIIRKQLAWDAGIPALSAASKLTRTEFWPHTGGPPTWQEFANALALLLGEQLDRTATFQLVETIS